MVSTRIDEGEGRKMKIKRIWGLYKELRGLRHEVVALRNTLAFARHEIQQRNEHISFLEEERLHRKQYPYDTKTIIIPNMYGFEYVQDPRYIDTKPRAEYLMKRMTDTANLKLVDDLIREGYIRKVRDDEMCEMYKVKVVR